LASLSAFDTVFFSRMPAILDALKKLIGEDGLSEPTSTRREHCFNDGRPASQWDTQHRISLKV
jgi:hypothetical protein